jgi:hypothetical protein
MRKTTTNGGREINLGLIVPHSIYNERKYITAVSNSFTELQKSKRKNKLTFLDKYTFGHSQIDRIGMKVNPSPTG